jgi:hypothetical protein
MSHKKKDDYCHPFTFHLCNEAAQIVLDEQARLIRAGKFRGRGRIIEMMILKYHAGNLSRNDLGTESLETGKI